MSRSWSDITVTPGAHANARVPQSLALATPHLRPDQLAVSFAAIGATAPEPWRGMLRREPALVLAQIIAFHIDDDAQRFDLALEQGIDAAAREIRVHAAVLQDWLDRIGEQLPDVFADVLETLDAQMGLRSRAKALAAADASNILSAMQREGIMRAPAGDPLAFLQQKRASLRAAHRQLSNAVAALKPAATTAFAQRLKAGDMDPATGLIMAELTAAGLVDARLNRFTARHTAFYYGDLLGQKRRGAAPERALLHLPSGSVAKFIPAGTALVARQADGKKLRFLTQTDVPVTPARVKATAVLAYDTDREMSLFSTLGAITGVRAAMEPADAQPLNRRVFASAGGGPIDMGLDVASDMFELAEGKRRIDVAFRLRRATDFPLRSTPYAYGPHQPPAVDPDIRIELQSDGALLDALGYDSQAAAMDDLTDRIMTAAHTGFRTPSMETIYETIANRIAEVATDATALRLLLGRIVTLGILENNPWPQDAFRDKLDKLIATWPADLTSQHPTEHPTDKPAAPDSKAAIVEALARENGHYVYSPADIFAKMLSDAFTITLTGADGPMQAAFTQILPRPENGKDGNAGFLVRLDFGPEFTAITSGTKDKSPVLSLRWNPLATACPISFFERYTLEDIEISVTVAGLRTLAGFSDDGAVSPAQAFLPFGPRPTEGATFTVAATELARKPVTDVTVDMVWADLPDAPGGFASHYQGYPRRFTPPTPELRMDYLSGEGWKPVQEQPQPMINSRPHDGTLLPQRQLGGAVTGGGVAAMGHVADKPPKSRTQLRAGAVRLTMTGCGDFGQAQYPQAMVGALRPRIVPLGERPVPAAPYVPKLDSLQLGYRASRVMGLQNPDSARPNDKVTQVTPFGARQAFPGRTAQPLTIFPRRLGLGTLFVQLAGTGVLRRLGILFDIADSGHLRLVPDPVPLVWHYLTPGGWQVLPATAITSDTTDGLLKSGVVTLDLPDDAATPQGEMPGGGVWLAVSATKTGYESLPVLSYVRTNGVWATSVEAHDPQPEMDRIWSYGTAQPGQAPPVETTRRAPPRPAENMTDYLARVSERLRHRQRAVAPFDIERLVLETFPEVWRVKCLPHLCRSTPQPVPGAVTVVVVRHPPPTELGQTIGQTIAQERLFDAGTLGKIRAFVRRHSPQTARIEVVNPAFDRLHVRAAVRFAPFRDDVALARKLQDHLASTLSIWTSQAALGCFGWALDVPVLRAQIAAFEDVFSVNDFSVLHFVSDDAGSYRLADTAQSDTRGPLGTVIRPSRPWALPLSTKDHVISTVEEKTDIKPTQSGIGRLRVGDMLIVGQEARP